MNTPYNKFKQTKEWNGIKHALQQLIDNRDLELLTPPDYVIGYLVKQLLENSEYKEQELAMKDHIHNLIARNREVYEFLKQNRSGADEVFNVFGHFLNKTSYNSALGLSFANLLQLSSDPELFEQYDLKDIEHLYDSLWDLFKTCNDVYVDAAYFANAISDDKIKARQIAEEGIKILKTQLIDLEKLLKDLNS